MGPIPSRPKHAQPASPAPHTDHTPPAFTAPTPPHTRNQHPVARTRTPFLFLCKNAQNTLLTTFQCNSFAQARQASLTLREARTSTLLQFPLTLALTSKVPFRPAASLRRTVAETRKRAHHSPSPTPSPLARAPSSSPPSARLPPVPWPGGLRSVFDCIFFNF